MIAPWIRESRRPIVEVAGLLDWAISRQGMVCPACNESHRDRRGAAGLTRDGWGWACHLCGAEGDSVDLAAYIGHGKRLRDLDAQQRGQLRQRLTELQLTTGRWSDKQVATRPMRPLPPPPVAVMEGPSAAEVEAIWTPARAVVADAQVREYAVSRGYDPEALLFMDIARATLPADVMVEWPAWWRRGRARTWRLVSRMWSSRGELLGLHGRAVTDTPVVDGKPLPKALGHAMRDRAWLANPAALRWLRGGRFVGAVAIAEGITDFLALSCWAYGRSDRWAHLPILGGVSGSFQAAEELPLVEDGLVLVATHTDAAGDRYADEINSRIGRRCDVRRFRTGDA